MKSKKAFIKLNGEIGEKDQPCIEYVDKKYLERLERQKNEVEKLLARFLPEESSGGPGKIKNEKNPK
jgi:hypothetical protein